MSNPPLQSHMSKPPLQSQCPVLHYNLTCPILHYNLTCPILHYNLNVQSSTKISHVRCLVTKQLSRRVLLKKSRGLLLLSIYSRPLNNKKIHENIKNEPLGPILSHMNSLHILTDYSLVFHRNIILRFTSSLPSYLFSSETLIDMYGFPVRVCYMSVHHTLVTCQWYSVL